MGDEVAWVAPTYPGKFLSLVVPLLCITALWFSISNDSPQDPLHALEVSPSRGWTPSIGVDARVDVADNKSAMGAHV